ncbi:MAG: 2-dehydro-3-deoxygalactonokinase, partial [Limisphaerales bacterium]
MHAHPGDEFLSCDWGTSTFRIRWISKGEIAQEYADAIGCKAIFAANSENQTARAEAFENQLNKALATFDRISNPLPLVISGMASSTIGWRELPYAPLPLKLDGSNLRIECIAWKHPALISQIYLVSGAASENEMMRGEESEAIGLLNSISSPPTSLLILPGTHSKHLSIASSQITSIRTFMTGELYDLITTQSVLRASVNPSTTQDLNAFNEGMHCVIERGLSGALFQTRTRQVLQGKHPESNASFLSGALIGAEFESLRGTKTPLLIAGADPVREVYAHAAKSFDLPARVFSSEQVKLAV